MKKFFFYPAFWLLLLIVSCHKDKPVPTEIPPVAVPSWKKFVGTYQVKNLNTDEEYIMKISHFSDSTQNLSLQDSLRVLNFDNQFAYNILYQRTIPDNYLQIIWHYGIRDKNNNRWAIYTSFDDTTTTIKENMLINDTIIFYIRKSNIAFWQPDGTWYYDCYCKHLAVKVSDD